MKKLDKITPIKQNFSKWFTDVVLQGDLIDYGPVKGTMFFKPNSFGIWENIQKELNKILKREGVLNVSFPLLIPESLLLKEKDHIRGFSPELLKIAQIKDKLIEDPYCIRPTSEMLFGYSFAKDVESYKDLPIVYNQWCNVVRWEKTFNPFLRNTEFLWQEGHTVHSSSSEAKRFARKMINVYALFLERFLAVPTIIGKKTKREKFAGAVDTFTVEAVMKDGKVLQSGTSHYLGQNFSKVLDIRFKNQKNTQEFAYQTSWGVSTRLIGAIIMNHGDDRGIIIPPLVAPYQVDIIDFFSKKFPEVREKTSTIFKNLQKTYRIRWDKSAKNPGFKVSQSEVQGTPLRIEVGPEDIQKNQVIIVRRDTLAKQVVAVEDLKVVIKSTLTDIQENLLTTAKNRLKANIVKCFSYKDLKTMVQQNKLVLVPFAGNQRHEQQIQNDTTATARCIPFRTSLQEPLPCIITKKPTKKLVFFARAY